MLLVYEKLSKKRRKEKEKRNPKKRRLQKIKNVYFLGLE
jgi:hypothetical protein